MFAAMDNGTLIDVNIYTDEKKYATVVAVSGGYPEDYKKNLQINGIADLQMNNDSIVFHAGTKINEEGNLVSNGGRVLAVTSVGETITDAANKSKKILEQIHFEGMYFRKDIGYEFEENVNR
jgi:phosphoribosylamine--glycine ligase